MKRILTDKKGETHINTAIIIVIAVVVGALILGGLYLLFAGEGGIMDKLDGEVAGMMDYTQELRYERHYDEESNTYILRYSYDGKHWNDAEVPTFSETTTVYGVMSNNSESEPIEVALMQDGSQYYILASTDGGITWTQRGTFSATAITHFYYGTDDALPSESGSFSGENFVIRRKSGSYYTMVSNGLSWSTSGWSDIIRPN